MARAPKQREPFPSPQHGDCGAQLIPVPHAWTLEFVDRSRKAGGAREIRTPVKALRQTGRRSANEHPKERPRLLVRTETRRDFISAFQQPAGYPVGLQHPAQSSRRHPFYRGAGTAEFLNRTHSSVRRKPPTKNIGLVSASVVIVMAFFHFSNENKVSRSPTFLRNCTPTTC
jgi:hypothetical protein